MKMKRIISIVFALLLTVTLSSQVQAQDFGGPESMRHKVVVGGGFNLGFNGNSFYVGVSSQAGFRLTRSLELGLRVGYDLYYHYRDYYYGNYFCHYFSAAAYANFEVFRGIYLQVEDEELCQLVSGHTIGTNAPTWYNSVFAGIGYRQYWGNSYTYYSVLYNLSWDYYSPYASPFVVRVGYCYGF